MSLDLDAFLDKTYGFPEAIWHRARTWLIGRLRQVAASGHGETITYGDLTDELRKRNLIDLEPHGAAFAALLGQINIQEHDDGNPLISAVVVSRETRQPGVGFWNIAADLGLSPGETPDQRELFWLTSLKECHERWRT